MKNYIEFDPPRTDLNDTLARVKMTGKCRARADVGYVCTRTPGHDGSHIAHAYADDGGVTVAIAQWEDDDDPTTGKSGS